MLVFVALYSLFTIIISLPLLFVDLYPLYQMSVDKAKAVEKAEAETQKNTSDLNVLLNWSRVVDEYDDFVTSSMFVTSSLLIISGIATFSQIAVIVWALVSKTGTPLIGYLALAVWFIATIWLYVVEFIKMQKANTVAEVKYRFYLPPKRNWLIQAIYTLPSVYALYIFLILIGLLH